jgi:hypothetical protein
MSDPLVRDLQLMSSVQLSALTTANGETLKNQVTDTLSNSFGQSLGRAVQVSDEFNMMSNYKAQSNNLLTAVSTLESSATNNVDTANRNSDTAQRTREIKEWYYNNKLDTLFVFQLIFIGICFLAVLAFANKLGYIGNGVIGISIGVIIVIMILLISNRAIYTNIQRNKRFWSKNIYGVPGSPLPGGTLPTKCPT